MSEDGQGLAGCRVLVVEDESLVSMLLEEMLELLGCEVVGSASRFSEAMEKVGTLAFDTAILDVNLHGEASFPIAELLLQRSCPFLLSTGYGAGAIPAAFAHVPILQKPFRMADLEHALLRSLAPARDPGKVQS